MKLPSEICISPCLTKKICTVHINPINSNVYMSQKTHELCGLLLLFITLCSDFTTLIFVRFILMSYCRVTSSISGHDKFLCKELQWMFHFE